MIFNPENKLEKLFKKYMDIGPNRPQRKMSKLIPEYINDNEFVSYFYHQMEYFNWLVKDDEIIFAGGYCDKKPTLLHIFFGQEDKLSLIHKEFTIYIKEAKSYLIHSIVQKVKVLKNIGVPCKNLYIKDPWNYLLESTFLDMQVIHTSLLINKIESPKQFGRFIEFSLD